MARGAAINPVGHLRITCSNEFGRIYVGPILTEFLDSHPDVTAEVLMVDRIVNIIDEGFDIAVRIGPLPSSGLSAIKVGQVRRIVCGAPEYFARSGTPLSPKDLKAHRLLAASPVSPTNEWRFGQDTQESVRVEPKLILSSVAAAIAVAKQGWGLARFLSYQVRPELLEGTLKAVLTDYEPAILPIHLVHVEGRRAPAKVRAFIDFARKRLLALEASD
nr:LysR substrate-binding domain-containing protein [Erythrobacter ani]